MNLYKMLWSNIGGRMWTHIYRDFYHSTPYAIQFIWFNVGLWIGINFDWKIAYGLWLVYTIGFLFGHFHWGEKWIYHQGLNGYK